MARHKHGHFPRPSAKPWHRGRSGEAPPAIPRPTVGLQHADSGHLGSSPSSTSVPRRAPDDLAVNQKRPPARPVPALDPASSLGGGSSKRRHLMRGSSPGHVAQTPLRTTTISASLPPCATGAVVAINRRSSSTSKPRAGRRTPRRATAAPASTRGIRPRRSGRARRRPARCRSSGLGALVRDGVVSGNGWSSFGVLVEGERAGRNRLAPRRRPDRRR